MLLALLAGAALATAPQEPGSPASQRGTPVRPQAGAREAPGYATRHALVVGVDRYADEGFPDLAYAVKDARDFARLLVGRFGFEEQNVRLLVDGDATQDSLESALEEWVCDPRRVGPDDLVVVFFAGHGVTRSGGGTERGYLVPSDGERDRLHGPRWSSLVGMNDLADVSDLIPAKHVLFLLDCCFGGLVNRRSGPPLVAGLDDEARQILTAGGADQTVLDDGGGGNSVFTAAVLAALGGAGDGNADGVVSFGELFDFVARQVETRTAGRQTPLQSTFPDHQGGNVALFPPDVSPARQTPGERLRALQRTAAQQLAELERLSDALVVGDLAEEAHELWPRRPELVPRYRGWVQRARELLARRSLQQEHLVNTRREAYLQQVRDGRLEENEAGEPDWDSAPTLLRWRHEVSSRLIADLDRLEVLLADIEGRLATAESVYELSVRKPARAWAEIAREVGLDPRYGGLDLAPQVGLVPLGRDPSSGLFEFCEVTTGTVPERGEDGRLRLSAASGLVLVLLPGGEFHMGTSADPASPRYWPGASSHEGPVHRVTLSPFFLSKYEMTQAQWLRLMGDNPSRYPMGKAMTSGNVVTAMNPVCDVSWFDCREAMRRLGLSLPSEAQWEYAARGGRETPWWTGAEKATLEGAANVVDEWARKNGGPEVWEYESWEDGYLVHAPVGTFAPNPFGLHDVHGNVWEWCEDGFYNDYYSRSPERDPVAPPSPQRVCVARGGGAGHVASYARCAYRMVKNDTRREGVLGLRPARRVEPE